MTRVKRVCALLFCLFAAFPVWSEDAYLLDVIGGPEVVDDDIPMPEPRAKKPNGGKNGGKNGSEKQTAAENENRQKSSSASGAKDAASGVGKNDNAKKAAPPPPVEDDAISLFVNSREFDIAIAPADEASKSAENSVLYERDADGEWREVGPCRRVVKSDGDIRFTREVEVLRDGIYYYTSRPVVAGEVTNPPKMDDPAQASVIVDTLPPIANIVSPEESFATQPGKKVTIKWRAEDEHLADGPAALSFSADGGRSWNPIAQGLDAEGEKEWIVPPELAGPAMLRVAAADRAGNVGRSLRSIESVAPPKPVVKKEPEKTAPKQEAITVPSVRETPRPAPKKEEPAEDVKLRDPNASWLYYLMALNLMRQNKPADALQYYWLSVREDPDFVNAWADIALAYNDLGAFGTARDVVEKARKLAPDRIDLMHLLGETYHAEGMEALGRARSAEEKLKAKAAIDRAVDWYGKAIDTAAKEWKLAEQAASFYRLGEICYYVNMDPEGARAYWEKILKLHIPTPNSDLLHWTPKKDKSHEKRRYERNTDQWVALHTWQNWARGYLEQMNERERRGIVELMKAQRINRARQQAAQAGSLAYSGNEMNPGREDGRSLFSLSSNLGSPDDVAACVGTAGAANSGVGQNGRIGAGIGGMNEINFPAHMNRDPLTSGYSLYADKAGRQADASYGTQRGNYGRGLISGGPEQKTYAPADPYAFPSGGQPSAPWNSAGPYGNQPIR